uniref:Uncharacterized protein n=1 Tax=Brassica campestris TaxID=3711 RepID=A0A3P5Y124_BRACM|nr:unnamed protein product [Brassica rapa]
MVRGNVQASLRASRQAPWAKSRRPGAWVGLMTDPKPNQKGRRDASGRKGATLGRWCPFASKSCLFVGQDLPPRTKDGSGQAKEP